MKKTKLFLSLAALALVFSLGACEGDVIINVGDVDVGLGSESSEDSGSETSSEGGETGLEEGIVFGFELDGVLNGIDGGYILNSETGDPYLYELTYTSNLNDALKFTYEEGENLGEYYISTEIDGVETWVAIVTSGTFNNVNYVTEKTPLYWNPTYECWGNQEQTYFLCQNAKYECFYCSAIAQYIDSSPIAGLYNTDGSKVTGFVGEEIEQEELPSSEVTYVGDVTEGTYKFGAFDSTSWSYLYISTGVSTASNHYLIPTSDWTYGANISITSYEGGYTLSYQLGEETRYITYTGSSTAVTTGTDPYIWYYDSDNAVFTSAAENGRFLGLAANADAFRAFSYNNNGLTTYAHAIPYKTEPTPDEKPGGDDDDPNQPGTGENEFPYEVGETYWFGYEYNDALYSFTGAIKSSYYGDIATDTNSAVSVILGEAEGGYTLSFDDAGTTKYISISANGDNRNFGISEEPFVWEYNATYDTFVAFDTDKDAYYFIGNYYGTSGTQYDELRASDVGYLDGTITSSNTQYPAHLYAQETPTTLTITGGRESLYVGNTVKLGIEVTNRASHDVTWSSSDSTSISVDTYGNIEALALAENVTITATSIKDENVTASIDIAVIEQTQTEVELCTYDFSKKTDTNNSVRSTSQMETIFSQSFVAAGATSNIVSSVTTADTIYAQAGGSGSNTNLQLSTACIKFGKSSAKGELVFNVSNTVTKVEVVAAGWSGSQPLTINTVQKSITQSAGSVSAVSDLSTYSYEIEEATSIDMLTSERVLVFSVTLYGYL